MAAAMNIAQLNAASKAILDQAHKHDEFTVRTAIQCLLVDFAISNGGLAAVEMLDQALGKAKR